MRENEKHITRVSGVEARRLKDETDDARLNWMTEEDIAKAAADDPDSPPLDLNWTQARVSLPPGKDMVTLRIDRDVLDWLRAQGKGYQTLINRVLRSWFEAAQREAAAVAIEKKAAAVAIRKAAAKRAAKKAATKRAAPAKQRA